MDNQAQDSSQGEVVPAVQPDTNLDSLHRYLAAVRTVVGHARRTDKMHHLLLAILDQAARLPNKILNNSRIINVRRTPSSFLVF